jgi:hypothetical protein
MPRSGIEVVDNWDVTGMRGESLTLESARLRLGRDS